MPDIGIVGAGVAGLHLGLFLRQHDIPVTLYSDRTGEQLSSGRLPNSVAHHHTTVTREQALGIGHWDLDEYFYFCHHHYVSGPQPLFFQGDFAAPSRAIDYRVYLPRLLEEYENRGGRLEVRAVEAADVEALSERHDMVVIASGKGSLSGMFPRRADKSPYDTPQRQLCVGLWHGVRHSEPRGVTMSISPGHGELLEIPIYSFEGHVTALLFESVPGGDQEELSHASYDDDPAAFEKLTLNKIQQHHHKTFERIDQAQFRMTRPHDLLQGAIVPTVREDYLRLPNGRYALAMGDAHTVVDPVVGQGANAASYSAWTVGETILEDFGFDERFCQKVANRRANRVHATSDWTNFMIGMPPPPNLVELLAAMSANRSLADAFTDNFSYPEQQWDVLATPERTNAFIAKYTPA